MYKTLILMCWVVTVVYSRPVQTVCPSNAGINEYLLKSFNNYVNSRSYYASGDINACIEKFKSSGLSEHYCKCNTINLSLGVLADKENEETAVSGSGNGSTATDETGYAALDGCSVKFSVEIAEQGQRILGGEIAFYKRSFNPGDAFSKLTVTILTQDNNVIQRQDVTISETSKWIVFPIDEYVKNLQPGTYETQLKVIIKAESGQILSCEEAQKFFIFSCSAPAHKLEKTGNDNREPIMVLFNEKSSSYISQMLQNYRKRDANKARCHLVPHLIPLSQVVTLEQGEELAELQRETVVDIGSCVSDSPNVNCSPTQSKDLVYITKEVNNSNVLNIKNLPNKIAIQC